MTLPLSTHSVRHRLERRSSSGLERHRHRRVQRSTTLSRRSRARTNASAPTRAGAAEPLFECFWGEGGDAALVRDAGDELCDVAEERELRRQIHEAGSD